MKQLVIDRSKWRTGNDGEHQTGEGDTRLINKQGYMCCLGFYMRDLANVDENVLLNEETPAHAAHVGIAKDFYNQNEDVKLLVTNIGDRTYSDYFHTEFCEKAMKTNDNPRLTSEEREGCIKALFLKNGVEVSFINEYHKPNNK
jgi:hypothetical protein